MRLTVLLLIDRTGQAGVILLCCLFHELGHIFFMIFLGFPPKKICLLPLSADIEKPNKFLPLKKELLIHLGGILTNFAVSSVFIFAFTKYKCDIFLLFSAANLAIGVFNLTPISGLDGGNFLYALLCSFTPSRADSICTLISRVFGFLFACLATFLALKFYNPALLLFCIYIFFMGKNFRTVKKEYKKRR